MAKVGCHRVLYRVGRPWVLPRCAYLGNCVWGTGVILNLRIFLHPVRHNQNESKETLKAEAESAKRCSSGNQNSLKSFSAADLQAWKSFLIGKPESADLNRKSFPLENYNISYFYSFILDPLSNNFLFIECCLDDPGHSANPNRSNLYFCQPV